MFNKSPLFNRNESESRRDPSPGSPAAASSNTRPSGGNGENGTTRPLSASGESAARPVNVKDSSVSPSTATPTLGAATSPQSAPPASDDATDKSVPELTRDADSDLGARLIVGPDVKLKGAQILDCDTLVVEGRVEATMDSRVIRIAEHGAFIGKVSIDIAEIHGSFEGELTARSQLIIHSTGRVNGTIRYGRLVAEEGGELCGDINVLSSATVTKKKSSSDALNLEPPGMHAVESA